jgi:hypothetical protein
MESENERNSECSVPESSVQKNETCRHHWMIQSAMGPVSEGFCQNCGDVKVFKNSIDYEDEWTNRRDGTRSRAAEPPRALDDSTRK